MSTETIFRHLGRINDSHTGIGPGKTREEYLNLFSRVSFSTQNEWPYSSPFAGFYDVSNSSTRLILLNQRYKYSHLRGQVLPRQTSNSPEDNYKTLYESIIESKLPPEKNKPTHKLHEPRIKVDPYRHFDSQNQYWHNRMCKGFVSSDNTEQDLSIDSDMTVRSRRPHTAGSSPSTKETRSVSAPRRSISVLGPDGELRDNYHTDPAFAESLWQYYRYQLEKSGRPKIGLQQYRIREPPSRFLKQSGIYRNRSLTPGQKLYLLEKCHIYDIEDSKTRHVNSYLQLLANRLNADLPSYKLGLNDARDFSTYEKFVKTPRPTARPLNTGYFTAKRPHRPRLPGSHNKHRQFSHDSPGSLNQKDCIVTTNPTVANRKLLKDTARPQSSQRLSASSIPIKNENNINIRFRHETTKIPVH